MWSRNKKGRAEAKYFVKYKNDEKESAWVDSSLLPGDLLEEFERNYKGCIPSKKKLMKCYLNKKKCSRKL